MTTMEIRFTIVKSVFQILIQFNQIRGQMAGKVIGAYGNTNRAKFIFGLLDGRPLSQDDYKKLLYQCLKK